jgi:hypothetical protein
MAALAHAVQQLIHNMRQEQQMIRTWAQAQAQQNADIKAVLDRLGKALDQAQG